MARRILFNNQSISTDIDRPPLVLDSSLSGRYAVQLYPVSGSISKDVISLSNIFIADDKTLEVQGEAWRTSGSSVQGTITVAIGDSVSGSHIIGSIDEDVPEVFNLSIPLTSTGYSADTKQNIVVSMSVSATERFFQHIDNSGSSVALDPVPTAYLTNPIVSIIDTISGSIGTLQQVTDNGNVTTQSIQVQDLRADGNLHTNYSGPEGDGFVYFYDGGSPTGKSLKWNDSSIQFEIDGTFVVVGLLATTEDARIAGDIRINASGPDGDSFLYFYEGGSPTGAALKWDDSVTGFEFSHDLVVGRDFTIAGISSTARCHFLTGGNQEQLLYNSSANSFFFTDTLDMATHKITSVVDPTADQDAATKKYVDDNDIAQIFDITVALFSHVRLIDWSWFSTDLYLRDTNTSFGDRDTVIYMDMAKGTTSVTLDGEIHVTT